MGANFANIKASTAAAAPHDSWSAVVNNVVQSFPAPGSQQAGSGAPPPAGTSIAAGAVPSPLGGVNAEANPVNAVKRSLLG